MTILGIPTTTTTTAASAPATGGFQLGTTTTAVATGSSHPMDLSLGTLRYREE